MVLKILLKRVKQDFKWNKTRNVYIFFLEAFDNGVSILNKLFWTMNSIKKGENYKNHGWKGRYLMGTLNWTIQLLTHHIRTKIYYIIINYNFNLKNFISFNVLSNYSSFVIVSKVFIISYQKKIMLSWYESCSISN